MSTLRRDSPQLARRRQTLRHQETPAERRLWQHLRNRQIEGFKFRRQASLGRYVVDFLCAELHVAIELDGTVHDDPARRDYDIERQAALEENGVRVVRFSNDAVFNELPVILDAIAFVLREEGPRQGK
ncbi:MAG: endonuclease domain-containing protein [Bacteroidota bacterium]